ncbi:MAG TPA: hypothetical protein VMW24_24910 [Sedimentisphaerales bacterium]|nr:hypothetical protein [Sedimentisphaerales bacterium]
MAEPELRAFAGEWGGSGIPDEAKQLQKAGWQLVAGDCLEGADCHTYIVWVLRKPEPTLLEAARNMIEMIRAASHVPSTNEWGTAFLQLKQIVEREERRGEA